MNMFFSFFFTWEKNSRAPKGAAGATRETQAQAATNIRDTAAARATSRAHEHAVFCRWPAYCTRCVFFTHGFSTRRQTLKGAAGATREKQTQSATTITDTAAASQTPPPPARRAARVNTDEHAVFCRWPAYCTRAGLIYLFFMGTQMTAPKGAAGATRETQPQPATIITDTAAARPTTIRARGRIARGGAERGVFGNPRQLGTAYFFYARVADAGQQGPPYF